MKQKPNLNAKDNDNNTPLHIATSAGHLAIIKILLKEGADPTIENKKGNSLCNLAKKHNIFKRYLIYYYANLYEKETDTKIEQGSLIK